MKRKEIKVLLSAINTQLSAMSKDLTPVFPSYCPIDPHSFQQGYEQCRLDAENMLEILVLRKRSMKHEWTIEEHSGNDK